MSGGVDSTVSASLLREALPSGQVHAIHVDTGLLRAYESATVVKALQDQGIEVTLIDASVEFLQALRGIVDPEEKRQIIGNLFMRITESHLSASGLEDAIIAQGTLRPDLIESASSLVTAHADMIKTHHNDTALVREKRAQGRILETNKDWHKDEIRRIGASLGLPAILVDRHPFPGPGLAVRILCAADNSAPDMPEDGAVALEAFADEEVSLAWLPLRTVGVQGDARTYKNGTILWGNAEWGKFKRLANEIPKTAHGVNRVVYGFGKMPTSLPQLTQTTVDETSLSQLREADAIVEGFCRTHGLHARLSQFPVILIHLDYTCTGKRSLVLRPFITNDFMTGRPALPGKDLPLDFIKDLVAALRELPFVSHVFYDLTSKPPGTTEWE